MFAGVEAFKWQRNQCTRWFLLNEYAERINHASTSHRPHIDHASTSHRPHIDLTSTLHRPHIDLTSTLHWPRINPHQKNINVSKHFILGHLWLNIPPVKMPYKHKRDCPVCDKPGVRYMQWRSQPDNLVPLCKFEIIIIIHFFRNWLFSQSIITKICIAGLNRRAGYAAGYMSDHLRQVHCLYGDEKKNG